jgi:uncharacterized membrane protein YdjX (TVP38/TMEM64 family)
VSHPWLLALPRHSRRILQAALGGCLVALSIAAIDSWQAHGIVFQLARADLSALEKISVLQAFFERWGNSAPAVYVAFVTIEVVLAPLPGLMLYAPGGLIFGALWGGFLALIGNVIGAGIACAIARNFAFPWLRSTFARPSVERLQQSLHHRGGWLVFLLRLNPLTSSDLVSYAAGLTGIPLWQVMLATAGGMAPLCFAQSWLSEGIFTAFPMLLYPLLIASAIYLVLVVYLLRRLLTNIPESSADSPH